MVLEETCYISSISGKRLFIYVLSPQTGQHILQPLVYQSWGTGWNRKKNQRMSPLRLFDLVMQAPQVNTLPSGLDLPTA